MANSQPEGFYGGWHQAQMDQLETASAQLQTQQQAASLQSTRLANEQTQLTLSRQEQMLSAMQKMNKVTAADPSGMAKQLAAQSFAYAEAAYQVGLPQEAAEWAQKGSQLLDNASKIEHTQAETSTKQWQTVSNLATWVQAGSSPQERASRWNMANMMLPVLEPGLKNPYAGKPYDPKLVQALSLASQTAQAQAAIQRDKAAEAKANSDIQMTDLRKNLVKAQTSLTKKREAYLGKQGGKDRLTDEDKFLTDVTDEAATEYDTSSTDAKDLLRGISRPVAQRAYELHQQGYDRDTAVKRAYNEAKLRGSYNGAKQKVGRESPYAAGKDSENPVALPPAPNAGNLRKGTWYKNKSGQVAMWNGSKFVNAKQVLSTY